MSFNGASDETISVTTEAGRPLEDRIFFVDIPVLSTVPPETVDNIAGIDLLGLQVLDVCAVPEGEPSEGEGGAEASVADGGAAEAAASGGEVAAAARRVQEGGDTAGADAEGGAAGGESEGEGPSLEDHNEVQGAIETYQTTLEHCRSGGSMQPADIGALTTNVVNFGLNYAAGYFTGCIPKCRVTLG